MDAESVETGVLRISMVAVDANFYDGEAPRSMILKIHGNGYHN